MRGIWPKKIWFILMEKAGSIYLARPVLAYLLLFQQRMTIVQLLQFMAKVCTIYGSLQLGIIKMIGITIQCHRSAALWSVSFAKSSRRKIDLIIGKLWAKYCCWLHRSHHCWSFSSLGKFWQYIAVDRTLSDLHNSCQHDATSQHFLDLDPHRNLLKCS